MLALLMVFSTIYLQVSGQDVETTKSDLVMLTQGWGNFKEVVWEVDSI